jgi:phosphoribulokinase
MSSHHPIVAVTGSSGAGSPVVTHAIRQVLERLEAQHVIVDGDGFHRYERSDFPKVVSKAAEAGRHISHFSPEANLLDLLESLMREFGEKGRGMHRRYIHDTIDAQETGSMEGTFTAWEAIPEGTDILIYEGLHGCFVSETVDITHYVDLKVGVVPIVNLEWMQKIQRDTSLRGYSVEAVMHVVERRLGDYVRYITPQFALTDINFQRIPLVDTTNPFEAQELPTLNESMIIIHFRHPKRMPYSFPELLKRLPGAYISRQNNVVIPGRAFEIGMQVVLEPLLERLLSRSRFDMT